MTVRFLCGVILAIGCQAVGGDLNPPLGPIAPTMKTLDEVEPRIPMSQETTPGEPHVSVFAINSPGSYYLTGDVEVEAGSFGIIIDSSDITIDLNGFSIVGSENSGIGISPADNELENVTIRNGTLRELGSGIDLYSTNRVIVEGVSVHSCPGFGIAAAEECRITACRVSGFLGAERAGIHIFSGIVERCIVKNGGSNGWGIYVQREGSILDCQVGKTEGYGFEIGVGVIERCKAQDVQTGFVIGGSSVVRDCVAIGCEYEGFASGSATSLNGCVATNNMVGFFSGKDCVYTDCTASLNVGDGFRVLENATLAACHAHDNGGSGFRIEHSAIAGCSAVGNDENGILATASDIRDCRVQGNTLAGIRVDALGSIVVRNTASSNGTNYSVNPGNDVGTIQTSPVGAGAWDNFED